MACAAAAAAAAAMFPYLTYGFRQDRSPDCVEADAAHTDNCDESILARWSAGIMGVALHRHANTILHPEGLPVELVVAILRLLYVDLWAQYILDDAKRHAWTRLVLPHRQNRLTDRIMPPREFQCRNTHSVSSVSLYDTTVGCVHHTTFSVRRYVRGVHTSTSRPIAE